MVHFTLSNKNDHVIQITERGYYTWNVLVRAVDVEVE